MTANSRPQGQGDWELIDTVPNPWGVIPKTAGGRYLPGRASDYVDRLLKTRQEENPVSRRHHYVPQTYLRVWSSDSKRIWTLNTAAGTVKPLGIKDVCVEENFYRVTGPDGAAHNRVELLFGVVDNELRRVQKLFNELENPNELEFDDLIALGVTIAVQRMRTKQQRRIQQQHSIWLNAQNPREFALFTDPNNPHRAASIHTEMLFSSMWNAADVLTTRQIEIWHDPQGRFTTCDAPVLVPFRKCLGQNLLEAPYIIWPISPHRAIVLSDDHVGVKAVLREADGRLVGLVRNSVEQGREGMIFASQEQRGRLPEGKNFRRRTQIRLQCSQRGPNGDYVKPPGCCVKLSSAYAAGPEVALCNKRLHRPAPDMWIHK